MLVFKTESHKKACKDFTLADIQEGNSNISAGNNIQSPGNTKPVGSQVTYLANQEQQMIKSHYTCSIPKHFRYKFVSLQALTVLMTSGAHRKI